MEKALYSPGPEKAAFWQRRVVLPLLVLLRQGATPEKLSLAVALGFVMGIFPVLGTTTVLCVAVAAALRLNQLAAQVGNGASTLFFVALLIPFVRLGEYLTGSDMFPLAMDQVREVAKQGSVVFFRTFSVAILHGVLGWIVAAPIVAGALYFVLLPLLRRMHLSR
jgi:uncharacterized protein (DUF2062 family)